MNPRPSFRRIGIIATTTAFVFLSLAAIVVAVVVHVKSIDKSLADLNSQLIELKRTAHPQLRVRYGGPFHIRTPDRQNAADETDFTLDANQVGVQVFTNSVWKEPGRIETIWVSDWSPRSEMAKFEEFRVVGEGQYPSEFHIHAKPKPGASIAMAFYVTVLCE